MKTRVILTTVVSFLLLLAAIGAGLNAVFTVTLVESEFVIYSEEGRAEVEALKAELDGFVGDSTTFLDVDDIENAVNKYPCFRAEYVEKQYPKTVKVKIVESKEFFAVAKENGYAILDENGVYLHDAEENVNRMGGQNILLNGFEGELELGKRIEGKYFDQAFEMISEFSGLLPGVRANIISLNLEHTGSNNDYFVVKMCEGVQIEIHDPSEGIAIKARAAFTDQTCGYLALMEKNRMYGAIAVSDLYPDGVTVNVQHSKEQHFQIG